MTQFLPTFPAFITRRFSRTSNDDEVTNSTTPHLLPHGPSIENEDELIPSRFPSLEEGTSSSPAEPFHDSSSETPPQHQLLLNEETISEQEDSSQPLPRPVNLEILASQAAQENAQGQRIRDVYARGDALSTSSQEVVQSLRPAASSTGSSVRSAPDVILDFTLPEDDGMAAMRERIRELQESPVSNEEKARQMLAIMTERYNASRAHRQSRQPVKTRSISSIASPQLPSSVGSNDSIKPMDLTSSPSTSMSLDSNGNNRFQLTPEDRQPTFYQRTRRPSDGHGSSRRGLRHNNGSEDSDDDWTAYGCPHYKRNIKLQCSTCSRWYTCRFCHDSVEDHNLVRRETKNMLCMFCNCAQKASGICVECGQSAAWYYCDVCKLWDDNPNRSIYHCDGCGICRVGEGLGKDFHHCNTCGVCLEIAIADSHRCIERSTDCDCPICGEYMFTSPEKVVFMKCGHSIHQKCYAEHIQRSYRCPICSRSVLNMEAHFEHLKRLIAMQPMPPHLQDTKAWVYCNDCIAKTTVKYHWLGCACDVCDSFNTIMLRMLRISDTGSTIPVDAAADLQELRSPVASPPSAQPALRGRSWISNGQTLRSGISVSAVESATTSQNTHAGEALRAMRSASPTLQSPRVDFESYTSSGSDTDAEDSDEVSFWGGSPRPNDRLRSPASQGLRDMAVSHNGSNDSSNGDNENSDNEFDHLSDEPGTDDTDDEMDIVGHV